MWTLVLPVGPLESFKYETAENCLKPITCPFIRSIQIGLGRSNKSTPITLNVIIDAIGKVKNDLA